jgi:hypothetical protein
MLGWRRENFTKLAMDGFIVKDCAQGELAEVLKRFVLKIQ